MRTDIAPEFASAIERLDTAPGYLVQIDFPVPYRGSTRGDLTYNGQVWIAANVKITGISFNAAADQRGTLAFFDADGALTALLQHHGIADRRITIYAFDAGAIDHPVGVFVGAGSKVSGDDMGNVTIEMASLTGRMVTLPRLFITPENGFNHVPVAGTKYVIGQTTYTMETRR